MRTNFLFLFIFLYANLFAERNIPPTPEELQQKKWEYISTTAKLTEEECKIVKPIYMQYETGLWDLHKKNHPCRKEKKQPNYEELNDMYIEREVKQAELQQNYHQELKKVLSPEVLFRYYKAERSHKRELIFEMQHMQQQRHRQEKESTTQSFQ